MKRTLRSTRILLVLALMALVSGAAYAFTASNTVPASWAGAGSGAINGWNATGVSNIAYTLAANPANFASVSFDLNDHAATDVKVQLNSSGGTWYDCGASGASSPYSVTCTTPSESVQNADQLTVVALG